MWWETLGTVDFVIAHVSGDNNMTEDTLRQPNISEPINPLIEIILKQ
jgi:hypothetical protein